MCEMDAEEKFHSMNFNICVWIWQIINGINSGWSDGMVPRKGEGGSVGGLRGHHGHAHRQAWSLA